MSTKIGSNLRKRVVSPVGLERTLYGFEPGVVDVCRSLLCTGSGELGARRVGLQPLAAVRGANRHTLRSHSAAHADAQRVRIQKIRPVAVSIADPKFGYAERESREPWLRFFKSVVQVGIAIQSARHVARCAAPVVAAVVGVLPRQNGHFRKLLRTLCVPNT